MSRFIPAFDPPIEHLVRALDGEPLAEVAGLLDEVANALGVTPLYEFSDMREIPEDFDGDDDALEELIGPWEAWFDPADGRRTVNALVPIFSMPEADGVEGKEVMVAELEELGRCLDEAIRVGSRFRLELTV